jgi:hypothetical protein
MATKAAQGRRVKHVMRHVQSLEKLSVAMLSLSIGPAPLAWLLDCARGPSLGHGDLKRFATYGQILAPDKARAAG